MKRIENIYHVTQRLIGQIEPAGDASVDDTRLLNLEDAINLTEKLIDDIILVARWKGHHANSINRSGQTADKFIESLKERISPDSLETTQAD